MDAIRCQSAHCNRPHVPGCVIAGKKLCRECWADVKRREQQDAWKDEIVRQNRRGEGDP